MHTYDLKLRFSSPSVEIWREYRLSSKLDFIAGLGGAIGLILGISLLSLARAAIEAATVGPVAAARTWIKGM